MAEGHNRSRHEFERRSSRRRKKILSNDTKKDLEMQAAEDLNVPNEEPAIPECAICLQTCVYPARLPCSHIFCYLCLKGVACQSHRCAMCRQDIPGDYFEHPDLVQMPSFSGKSKNKDNHNTENDYQWFYEGRDGGWWQYDERTSLELELSFKEGSKNCEVLIAGFLYIADFDSMLQLRKNDPSRYRRIKRDLSTIPKKGIAGIRTPVSADSLIEQMSNLTISSPQIVVNNTRSTTNEDVSVNTSSDVRHNS